jgi:hypothetical protein
LGGVGWSCVGGKVMVWCYEDEMVGKRVCLLYQVIIQCHI